MNPGSAEKSRNDLSSFQRVVRNAGWNLLGNVAPLGAAVFAIPFLIKTLGVERFGIVTLAWVLIGYFTLFDLGLGRALTKAIAEKLETRQSGEIPSITVSGLVPLMCLGFIGSALVLLFIPAKALWLHRVPVELHTETINAVFWIAVGIPFVVLASALRGILEGFQDFRVINKIRIPTGVSMFVAPCICAAFTTDLGVSVASLVAIRLGAIGFSLPPCLRRVELFKGRFSPSLAKKLLAFGGWLTISNVVGPVIVYADRFVVGAVLSPAAVAYYSAPFEIVARLLILPVSLTTALFPTLVNSLENGRVSTKSLVSRATNLTFAVTFPIVFTGITFAKPCLSMWLGPDFAAHSAVVMQVLMVGFFFNSLAQVPLLALQSAEKVHVVAILHLAELAPYLALSFWLTHRFGLIGAAAAWSIRGFFDYVVLSVMWRASDLADNR